MSITARARIYNSLISLSQPLCQGCMRPLLTPTSLLYYNYKKSHDHTVSGNVLADMSYWEKFKWDIGLTGKLNYSKQNLIKSGSKIYVSCSDFINFNDFIKEVNLPDTFASWFMVLHLHLWMANVKVSQMGKEGLILKEHMYRAMWRDVERRLDTFKDMTSREKKKALRNFFSEMISSVLYYDEGLISSDKVLANCLWVQLFRMDTEVQISHLDLMVEYVRKQVYHHDNLDPDFIMQTGYLSFLPLLGDKLSSQKMDEHLKKLADYAD